MGVLLCFYCQVEKLTGLPRAKPVDDINIYMFVPNQGDLKPSEIGNSRMIETALGEEAKKVPEVNNGEVKKDEKKKKGEDKTKGEANEDSTDNGKGQTKKGKEDTQEEVNDGNKKK